MTVLRSAWLGTRGLIPALHFVHKFGIARFPKASGPSDHFFPELLASAKNIFMGINLSLSPGFLSLHCALLIIQLCSSALHVPLLSPQPPTMASTLHPATAFWILLPGDSSLFVSTLPSLICALPEGRAYFSATLFISCHWKTMIACLSSLSVTGNLFLFFLLLFFPP